MINIGVIGYGYWGPNLVRNFSEVPGARVRTVCDQRPERLKRVASLYPAVKTTSDAQDLFSDPAIDAVAIATPLTTHFSLAMRALKAGKHVLVEKPMTASVSEGSKLIETAAKLGKVLMVDHTFIYGGAVRKIKELVSAGRLGRLYYYDSVRVNLGLFQHDVNVLWDLAVHDLSILDHVLGKLPQSVAVSGMAHLPGEPEDVAYLTCFFDDHLLAHFHVNWLAPVKVRRTLIGGDKQMIVYDDLAPDEKVRIYDKGVKVGGGKDQVYSQLVSYRTGDMWAPKLDRAEALAVEAAHFIECVEKGRTPLSSGEAGLRVIRVLEAADKSLKARGKRAPVR